MKRIRKTTQISFKLSGLTIMFRSVNRRFCCRPGYTKNSGLNWGKKSQILRNSTGLVQKLLKPYCQPNKISQKYRKLTVAFLKSCTVMQFTLYVCFKICIQAPKYLKIQRGWRRRGRVPAVRTAGSSITTSRHSKGRIWHWLLCQLSQKMLGGCSEPICYSQKYLVFSNNKFLTGRLRSCCQKYTKFITRASWSTGLVTKTKAANISKLTIKHL